MPSFEEAIKKAVEDQVIPPVVIIAGDKTGKLNYRQSYGAISPDGSILTWMSMTKLVTAVAALQLVRRGVLDLDADVAPQLPELAAQPIITTTTSPSLSGGEDAVVKETARKTPLTLRSLLTHTSGLSYPFFSGPLSDLFARRGWDASTGPGGSAGGPNHTGNTVVDRFGHPLVFEPGEGWRYSCGIDWAGLLIERATGTSLQAYARENIWRPLGVGDDDAAAPFFPPPPPAALTGGRELVRTSLRDATAGKVLFGAGPPPPSPAAAGSASLGQGVCLGGEGMHGTADAYARVLASLLADDGALFPAGGASDVMFEPQFAPGSETKADLLAQLESPEWIAGYTPANGGEYNWAFGGLVVDGDSLVAKRRRGCLMWGGMYNSSWFIDREAGLYGLFATQILPPGDQQVREFTAAFQAEMYSRVES